MRRSMLSMGRQSEAHTLQRAISGLFSNGDDAASSEAPGKGRDQDRDEDEEEELMFSQEEVIQSVVVMHHAMLGSQCLGPVSKIDTPCIASSVRDVATWELSHCQPWQPPWSIAEARG